MNLEIKEANLKINWSEGVDLYWALVHDLESRIDTHWVNYPDVYKEQSSQKLSLIYHLARFVGQDFPGLKSELENRLAKAVKAKTETAPQPLG